MMNSPGTQAQEPRTAQQAVRDMFPRGEAGERACCTLRLVQVARRTSLNEICDPGGSSKKQ
jgi:hypothetical protein